MFFSSKWSVGKVVDYAASLASLKNNNNILTAKVNQKKKQGICFKTHLHNIYNSYFIPFSLHQSSVIFLKSSAYLQYKLLSKHTLHYNIQFDHYSGPFSGQLLVRCVLQEAKWYFYTSPNYVNRYSTYILYYPRAHTHTNQFKMFNYKQLSLNQLSFCFYKILIFCIKIMSNDIELQVSVLEQSFRLQFCAVVQVL